VKTALPLRPYQREALDKAMRKIVEDHLVRVAVVLPTGGGKTVCFAHQALEWLAAHPSDRVLILVDTDELVWQTVKKLLDVAPHLSVGVVKATKNEVFADVVVGSVQTLRNPKRRAQITGVGLLIVDECEMAVTPTCLAILEHFKGVVTFGYTATLMRSDGKSLGTVWQDAIQGRDISWMVRHRWLIPPRGLAVEVPDLDLRSVKSTRADFREGELGEALAESLAPELVAKAVLEHASSRKVLMFTPTVASAYTFATALEEAGFPAKVIHGGMGDTERKEVLDWHRRGTAVVNCMLLTKGYDDTEIDCIVMARPTKSKRLYIQIVGRGLRVDLNRPYEEQDCLLLDVVGANALHDLRSIVDLSTRPIKDPKDGSRTLMELEDELDAGPGIAEDEPEYWTGPVTTREFDPLGRPSTSVWLRTAGGTWFVPAGTSRYVFVMEYPSRGLWSVAQCPTRPADGRPVMSEHRGIPLEEALVWAGDLAEDLGADLNTTRKAPWRKKVASEKLQSLAKSLGLAVEGHHDLSGLFVCTEKAGPLSDRIDAVKGTRRIDPLVKVAKGRS
jgi:superfamily II DNA or RNA helicase